MTAYEITQIAHALVTGGWTSQDKLQFIEDNFRQEDEETVLTIETIDKIFNEIARIEDESHLES